MLEIGSTIRFRTLRSLCASLSQNCAGSQCSYFSVLRNQSQILWQNASSTGNHPASSWRCPASQRPLRGHTVRHPERLRARLFSSGRTGADVARLWLSIVPCIFDALAVGGHAWRTYGSTPERHASVYSLAFDLRRCSRPYLACRLYSRKVCRASVPWIACCDSQ